MGEWGVGKGALLGQVRLGREGFCPACTPSLASCGPWEDSLLRHISPLAVALVST